MGNLPKAKCPTDVVDVDGERVEVRGLTRGEVKTMTEFKDENLVDPYVVSCGVGVSATEAAEWLKDASMVGSQSVIVKILELSGMAPESGKG